MAGAMEALPQGLQRRCPLSHNVEVSSVGTRVRNERKSVGLSLQLHLRRENLTLLGKPFIPV